MVKEYSEDAMLRDIGVRPDVICPDRKAIRHLADFIDQHLVAANVVALMLRLPGEVCSTRRPPLERRVYATLWALGSASEPHQTYSVELAHASDSSPYFCGALAIRISDADVCVGFVLAGHYEQQDRTASVKLDLAFGRRIAQASATALLRSIATYIKVASARDEAARAGKNASRSHAVDYGIGAPILAAVPHSSGVAAVTLP